MEKGLSSQNMTVLSCVVFRVRFGILTKSRYFGNSVPKICTIKRDYKLVPLRVHDCQM